MWDLIFLYGAEVLFRVALAIWSSLQSAVLSTHTCDEFYMQMSTSTLDIRQGLYKQFFLKSEVFSLLLSGFRFCRQKFQLKLPAVGSVAFQFSKSMSNR